MTFLNWISRNLLMTIISFVVVLMITVGISRRIGSVDVSLAALIAIGVVALVIGGQLLAHYTKLRFLGWIITLIPVVLVLPWIYKQLLPVLPNWLQLLPDTGWSAVTWFVIVAGVLFMIAFMKGYKPLRTFVAWVIFVALILFLLLGEERFIRTSTNAQQWIQATVDGVETISIYSNGGHVDIPRGGRKTIDVEGTVSLSNRIGHCLNVSPSGVFTMTWSNDARTYYITPKSGRRERATVTSLKAGEEDC